MNLKEKTDNLYNMLPQEPPVGITFKTSNKYYYYDTPTGKILCCGEMEYRIINSILKPTLSENFLDDYEDNLVSEALENIKSGIEKEGILKLAEFKHMYIHEKYGELVQNHLQQITLELTERCNLRCGYCIYHEGCEKNRDFGIRDMSQETAFKAIEYAKEHSGSNKDLHITFYGGEPLLCYSLLKSCIEYAKKIMPDKKVYFGFTTNGVLITPQIADDFSKIENLSITVSLDGPMEYHDMYRVDKAGNGSFISCMNGLKLLAEAFGEERCRNNLLLSMVYTPPYSEKKLEDIQKFLKSLSWLPEECIKIVTYPNTESYETIERYMAKKKDMDFFIEDYYKDDSIISYTEKNWENKVFTSKVLEDNYISIFKRFIFNADIDKISLNGCCLPGHRKLYVTVDGNFKICEKVGNIPDIGSLSSGIDIDKVKKFYFYEYREKSMGECSTCWCARFCKICYARCYTGNTFDSEKKATSCRENKKSVKRALISYFQRLEQDPHVFDYLSDIIIG